MHLFTIQSGWELAEIGKRPRIGLEWLTVHLIDLHRIDAFREQRFRLHADVNLPSLRSGKVGYEPVPNKVTSRIRL